MDVNGQWRGVRLGKARRTVWLSLQTLETACAFVGCSIVHCIALYCAVLSCVVSIVIVIVIVIVNVYTPLRPGTGRERQRKTPPSK